MKTYPFIKKAKDKIFISLNKDLYKLKLLRTIAKDNPETIVSIRSIGRYNLVELYMDREEECLDFLDYLISRVRS